MRLDNVPPILMAPVPCRQAGAVAAATAEALLVLGSRMSAQAIAAALAAYSGYDTAGENSLMITRWIAELAAHLECPSARVPLLVQLAESVAAYAMQQPQVGRQRLLLRGCIVGTPSGPERLSGHAHISLQTMTQAAGAPWTAIPGASVVHILEAACRGPGAPAVVAAMVSTGLLTTLLEAAPEGQQDGTEKDEKVGAHALLQGHSRAMQCDWRCSLSQQAAAARSMWGAKRAACHLRELLCRSPLLRV